LSITIGIDLGGSITKIIGLRNRELFSPITVKSNDPISSLFGAFGKFLAVNDMQLSDVKQVMTTGAGSSFIDKPIYGLPTAVVEEFLSNGLGGLYLSGRDKAVIVSIGTGTSLVKADETGISHLGGTGMGGGTITGLSERILNIRDIEFLIRKAEKGDLNNVDLFVGDITKADLPGLPYYATASNFGKLSDSTTQEDIALGILNMVLQTIGVTAVFAIKNINIRDIVVIGSISSMKICRKIFGSLEGIFDVKFYIPKNSVYGTAIGAALAFEDEREYKVV